MKPPTQQALEERVAAEVADALSRLPLSLTPDRLESRIIMELAIRFLDVPGADGGWPDPLHPDIRNAVERVEECFCRYREELVEGEPPAQARAFWVAAALRILHRGAGAQALRALLTDPPDRAMIELPADSAR